MNRPTSKGSLLPMLLAATSMLAPPFEEETYANVNASRESRERDARVIELERERARKHERLQEIKRQRRKK